jgi:hypothetical protein
LLLESPFGETLKPFKDKVAHGHAVAPSPDGRVIACAVRATGFPSAAMFTVASSLAADAGWTSGRSVSGSTEKYVRGGWSFRRRHRPQLSPCRGFRSNSGDQADTRWRELRLKALIVSGSASALSDLAAMAGR